MTDKISKPFDFSNLELLKDPQYAAIYLENCLEDGNMELFQNLNGSRVNSARY